MDIIKNNDINNKNLNFIYTIIMDLSSENSILLSSKLDSIDHLKIYSRRNSPPDFSSCETQINFNDINVGKVHFFFR